MFSRKLCNKGTGRGVNVPLLFKIRGEGDNEDE